MIPDFAVFMAWHESQADALARILKERIVSVSMCGNSRLE